MPRGKTSTKLCTICSKEVSLFAFNRHVKSHEKANFLPKRVSLNCSYCGKLCKNKSSLSNHERRCPENQNRKIEPKTEDGIRRLSESSLKIVWTEERRKRHSNRMRQAVLENPESYTSSNVCGRVKIQEYSGHKFHGKWELEVAKWLDRNCISWERDIKPFTYFWNDAWHLYFPDFYLPGYNLYLEVKGYQTDRDLCKWSVVENLLVIRKQDIIKIMNNEYYIHNKVQPGTPKIFVDK